MNIEKLQMCRLCLVEDVRMFNVTNKDLQTVYEKLTNIPFVTEDSRPMLACVFCFTKLKQCCQLQKKCLEAEKLLTQMLNKDNETKPQINKELLVNIKEELPNDCEGHNDINEIKEELQTEPEYQDSCPDIEDMPTNHSESDSEDYTPVIEFKTKEEPEVSKKTRKAGETQSAPDAVEPEISVQITRLEDTTTTHEKKTGRNTQRRTTTARSKFKKVFPNPKSQDRKQKYKCDVCQHSFTSRPKLINHIRIHTGEKPYKCETCQKSFNVLQNLLRHNRVHTGEKNHKCDTCQRSFSDVHSLKKHFRVHTGERPYKCEICQKSFKLVENLNKHNRVHTGVKLYKCEICQRSFNDVYNLKTHVRLHSGEKPYKCEICEKSFSRVHNLKRHNLTHTSKKPYECEICQSSFIDKYGLKRHVRIHSGGQSYKCEICQRNFTYKSSLNKHFRSHSEAH